jgi:pyruvate dehydrogenase E2 component (dihydrolipoamide acetyltransferase)
MEEGVFIEWLKRDGESVKSGDALFTIESDKAAQEVEAIDAGTLHVPANGPQRGDKIKVGAAIGYLLADGETSEAVRGSITPAAAVQDQSARQTASESGGKKQGKPLPLADVVATERKQGAPLASPAAPASPRARRAAREKGVSLEHVSPSGTSGRIRERDVLKVWNERSADSENWEVIETQSMRRTIADRMVRSLNSTAPVTIHRRCDAVELVNLRNQLKQAAEHAEGPSFNDILMKIFAGALRRHPMLAARWVSDQIQIPKALHIGFAVDSEHGLFVPVIRDVLQLSLREVTSASRVLIEAARAGDLKQEQMQDGCFTMTSLGSFGVESFTPIINHPQTAILGVGAIRREAVAMEDGTLANRHQLTLSLTFDHRIVDGAPAARFLQNVCERIENPFAALLNGN